MPTLTVKNIPEELYQRIKESAAEHRRSINSEIIVCLERALASHRLDPDALLARADQMRERAALSPLTDDLLGEARRRIADPPAREPGDLAGGRASGQEGEAAPPDRAPSGDAGA